MRSELEGLERAGCSEVLLVKSAGPGSDRPCALGEPSLQKQWGAQIRMFLNLFININR